MPSKKISINKEIYEKLKKLKHLGESFSELLERLIKEREKSPLAHFGIAKDLPITLIDDFEAFIMDSKGKNKKLTLERFSKLWEL